jgi:toxin ParE1/3/4
VSRRRDLAFTSTAEQDLADIFDHTAEQFGAASRRRYEALIATALEDLRRDPLRIGTKDRAELGEGVRTYHIRHSRERGLKPDRRVRSPRHILVYQLPDPNSLLVLRVLHEAMDLARHLPTRSREDEDGEPV